MRKFDNRWTPIVLICSNAKEPYYAKGLAAEGDYYLTKLLSGTISFSILKGNKKMVRLNILSSLLNYTQRISIDERY